MSLTTDIWITFRQCGFVDPLCTVVTHSIINRIDLAAYGYFSIRIGKM